MLQVLSPAVPVGESRLRATVLVSHEPEDIEKAMDIIAEAAEKAGVI